MATTHHADRSTPPVPVDPKNMDAYRLVFDMNPQPMWVCDANALQFLAVNEAAIVKYGYSRSEFLSMTAERLFEPAGLSRFLERCRSQQQENSSEMEGTWRHCSKTGALFDVEMWSRSVPFLKRNALLMSVQDITARRQAENSLSTRYALTRLLTENSDGVMGKVLHCLGESLEFDLAELWLIDSENRYLSRHTGWAHTDLGPALARARSVRIPVARKKGTLARVWAYGTPNWIPDAPAELGFRKRADALHAAGVSNGLAFAVRNQGVVSGVVVLLRRSTNPPDPQLLQLLGDIGSQIGHHLERRRVQLELREAEESFRTLFDDSPIPCHDVDTRGVIVRVNQAQCQVLGKEASEIIGTYLWDLMVPEQREECRASVLKKIAERRSTGTFERRLLTQSGAERVFRVHDRILVNPQGDLIGLRGAMLDLTEAKRSRRQIELQTSLLDQVNDAIVTVDLEFRLTYCNGAAERLFGRQSSEMLGKRYKIVAGTMVTEAERETIHNDILKRGFWNGEFICTKHDGTRFVAHVSWSVLRDSSGQIQGVVGIHRDITTPKQMEQTLRATEDRLKLAQSALALGTWEVDLSNQTVQCSDQLLGMYGRSGHSESLTVAEWHAIVHPDDRAPGFEGVSSLFPESEVFDRQFRVVWPDGSVHWLHSKSRVIRDENQNPARVIGVDFDITDHKRTEERLRFLSSAVEQSPVSVLITGLDGKIEYINASLSALTGYSLDELRGKDPSILMPDDTPPDHYRRIAEAMETGGWRGVMRTRKKNGDLFWQSAGMLWIRDASGKPTHQLAVAEDITERLEMEAALKLSEERFRIAAESSGDSIYEWDLRSDGVTILGGSRQIPAGSNWKHPLAGTKFRALLHPVDREQMEAAIQRHLEHGEPYTQEYRLEIEAGRTQYFVDTGAALRDDKGQPYKWVGVCRDVTEQKKVERANAELAAIVECADTAIISEDLAGEVLTWNKGAERVYGYTSEEMIGKNMSLLVPADRSGEHSHVLERLRRGESVHHLETTRLTKAGELIHVLLTMSPIRDRNSKVIGMAHVAWNITQIKQMERQIAQTQKLESIGHLAAGIAHEINTPIQYIGDNGKFLEDAFHDLLKFTETSRGSGAATEPASGSTAPSQNALDEGVLDYLRGEVPRAVQQLLEGVDQVARIVRAMKEFSHPGPVEKMPIDLNRAIESTILVSKNEWKYVADLTTEFDRDLPPVPCIAGEFNQVMLNLIVNAAHAISDVVKKSNGKGKIHIRTQRNGRSVEIRVSDTGCGIPKAMQSKVFDPFFTTKPVGKGTGQGLAIAHSVIVQRHRGVIKLESEPDQGATFILQLPLECALEEA